jgi:hypothetical protein
MFVPAAGEGGPLGLIGQGGGSGGGGSSKHPHGLTRKNMRTGSEAIKALVEIVGTSGKIYQHLIDLCKVRLGQMVGGKRRRAQAHVVDVQERRYDSIITMQQV